MSSLKRRCRRSKKASTNPYSGRGLDKFALVSAELAAKREKLAAQLDTPLSMVKFALGSHNKWIPIILSRSTKREGNAHKKKSASEDKMGSRAHKGGLLNEGKTYVGGFFNKERAHLSGFISEDTSHGGGFINEEDTHVSGFITEGEPHSTGFISANTAHVGGFVGAQKTHLSGFNSEYTSHSGGLISEGGEINFTPLDGLNTDERTSTDSLSNEDTSHYTDTTAFDSLLGVDRPEALGEIIEMFSASSDVEHIAAHDGKANPLQGRNLKNLMRAISGVPWVKSKASTLASNIVFLRWATVRNTASAEKASLPKGEKDVNTASRSHVSMASSPSLSPSPLGKTSASSSLQAQLMPLPSPPARVKTASTTGPSDQDAIAENEDMGTPQLEVSKLHTKCKVKGFLKMRSAPSTPRNSRQPKQPFTASSTPPKTRGLNDEGAHTDAKEERSLEHKATNPQDSPVKSRFLKASATEKATKERARRLGQALAVAGLVLSLSGLLMGYVSAIVGVVCWWYVLPSLRKAVGDKPMVRSQYHSHGNSGIKRTLNAHVNSHKVIREVGSGKYDLQSQEYKKKVIMEGLLDRGRRSNA